eukprot:97940-Rhodomonas_salina.2
MNGVQDGSPVPGTRVCIPSREGNPGCLHNREQGNGPKQRCTVYSVKNSYPGTRVPRVPRTRERRDARIRLQSYPGTRVPG